MIKLVKGEALVAVVGLLLLGGLFAWQFQLFGAGKLSADDQKTYLSQIETNLDLPAELKADTLATLKEWTDNDDGASFYLVNLIRFFDKVQPYPGLDPAYTKTPQAANAHYEEVTVPLVLQNGPYPVFIADAAHVSLTPVPSTIDGWDRFIIVHYPNKRAFLELMADPAYGNVVAYKLMSMDIVLVPVVPVVATPTPLVLYLLIGLLFLGFLQMIRIRRLKADMRNSF